MSEAEAEVDASASDPVGERSARWDGDDSVGAAAHLDHEAVGVETFIRQEAGEWIVDVAVAFPDGVVRRSVNKYRSQRHAEIAAQRRAASRDIEGPING